jgi:hypothetical protein
MRVTFIKVRRFRVPIEGVRKLEAEQPPARHPAGFSH